MTTKTNKVGRHWPTVSYIKRARRWDVNCQNCGYWSGHKSLEDANRAYAEHANFYGNDRSAR